MLLRVPPANWRPQGVANLETAADEAVRCDVNALVVAGPGAGKTELLAQRACFLLQTRICPRPKRILAISFKRDAAKNLADRVHERCGEALARRFHSITFDAFAKGLIDRFGQSLPEKWRPRPNYAISFDIERRFRDYLTAVPAQYPRISVAEAAGLPTTAYRSHFIGRPLSAFPGTPATVVDRATDGVWQYLLHAGQESTLNFHMIGRLAEYLLGSNPRLATALRATYGFVFLDEFQDTTSIHYELTKTAFHGSTTVLTAVGDDKQSIMRWALALTGIFATFQRDFGAKVFPLVRNHRAAPKLVKVLGKLAVAIDPQCKPPEPVNDGKDGEGECRILVFPNEAREAVELSSLIQTWIQVDGVPPREICVLTRQKPDVYGATLLVALAEKGIPARVEEKLQALLAEPVALIILDCLKLAARAQAPQSWQSVTSLMIRLSGGDDEAGARRVAEGVQDFVFRLRAQINAGGRTDKDVAAAVQSIVNYVTRSSLIGLYQQYEQGTYLDDQLQQTIGVLSEFLSQMDWSEAIDAFEGKDAVPLMTIHKSKGLEYHTVVFLGLEDFPFRSFANLQDEEAAAFFVAFSRAKKRVVFTFSKERSGRNQSATGVKPLYQLLIAEGIKPEQFTQ